MKMIRWQGFLAFSGIVATVFLIVYLFAASFIKWGLTSAAETVFNARVEIQRTELDYSPVSLSIEGMTVGDDSDAMLNLFEFERAAVSIDLLKLLMGQVIVKDLDLQGLAFGTVRKESGLLTQLSSSGELIASSSVSDDVKSGLKQTAESAPDAKTLLSREPLKTDAAYNALNASIIEKQAYWKDIEATLPNDDAVASYEKRLKALFAGEIKSVEDYKQRKSKLDALKKSMQADRNTLSNAKSQLKVDRTVIKQQLTDLKLAPKSDYHHLKNKYGLNAGGVANISGLIFGPEIGQYSQTFLHWYYKAQPVMERIEAIQAEAESEEPVRAKGRYIRFYEANPQPDFIIQSALLSVITPQGVVQAQAKDITHQQHIINRPTTVTLSAEEWGDLHGFRADIIYDSRGTSAITTADLNVAQIQIAEREFSGSETLTLSLDKAVGTMKGQAKLQAGQLTAQIDNQFEQAIFSSEGDSSMAKEMGRAIESIHDFDLRIAAKGAVDKIDLSIRSNIDNKLKLAFKNRLSAKQKEWQMQLDAALKAHMNGYLSDIDSDAVLSDGQSINNNINQLDGLLDKKLDDFEAQEKAKAKKKADAEKDEQKNKLKNKFKNLF